MAKKQGIYKLIYINKIECLIMKKSKKISEFLNEKKSDDIGGAWEQAIAGYENAIVLICDHPGSKMLKEMKGELEKRKLEGFAKDNKVIIMPKEEGNSSFLKKFKKDFLGE